MGFVIPMIAAAGSALASAGAAAGSVMAGTASAATLGSAASTASMVSTGLSAVGSIVGGLGENAMYGYRAKVAENNATSLRAQANSTLQAGQAAESNQRLKTGELLGSEVAAQGANGVDTGFGSTKLVQENTQAMGDFDALTLRYNYAKQAMGQNIEAANQESEAAMDKASGRNAILKSFLGASSSLVGGFGKLASQQILNKTYGVGATSDVPY